MKNHNTTVLIDALGAEIKSIQHKGVELIYQKAEGFWKRSAPVLFPIVGKLNEDQFTHNGIDYHLNQHGFARDSTFTLNSNTETECCYQLTSDNKSKASFPFEFELLIYYSLKLDGLEIKYEVKSSDEIYYSIGAHPAFAIEGDISQYQLQFDKDEDVTYEGLINGTRTPFDESLNLKALDLSEQLFKNDTLIFKDLKSRNVEVFQNGVYRFGMSFDSPYFGIWKQKNSPFICLEPWWGVADSAESTGNLEDKEGIQRGDKMYEFRIEFYN